MRDLMNLRGAVAVLGVLVLISVTALGHVHPAECRFQDPVAPLDAEVTRFADDSPGEPVDPDLGMSVCSTAGTNQMPKADSKDMWGGLPDPAPGNSGGGDAAFEGDVWRVFSVTGVWSFTHYVQQDFESCAAITGLLGVYPPMSATAKATVGIRDAVGTWIVLTAGPVSGNQAPVGWFNFRITSPPVSMLTGHLHNVDVLIDGHTRVTTSDTWTGKVDALAEARAASNLSIVVVNRIDRCDG